MLVLTRREKQSLMIGDDIEIVVLECSDGSVKLGIKAPKDVNVFRKEIFDEIKRENSSAADNDVILVEKLLKQ